MLTERETARNWQTLFRQGLNEETFAKAEALIEGLRPESPLRHRLSMELQELRKLQVQQD